MTKRSNVSAGLLLFRRTAGPLEVFLAHPGGPFWAKRDLGAWTIPKGLVKDGEALVAAAVREFVEETGVVPTSPLFELGSVRQKAGKIVHVWAWEGDADPAGVVSNSMDIEWPRNSGKVLTVPEIDRCAWFDLPAGRQKINEAQCWFLDELERRLRA